MSDFDTEHLECECRACPVCGGGTVQMLKGALEEALVERDRLKRENEALWSQLGKARAALDSEGSEDK